jgi:hypothetical protein
MGFQFVVDNAESISINRKKIVASTQARDGTVRAVSRGGQVWQFDIKLPDGPLWTEYRGEISELEALDRVTTDTIQINDPGQSWLVRYQGDAANTAAITASWTTGNTITLTGGQAVAGYNFRAGDFLQLGPTGSVYTVAADVPFNSNTVTLHRPIIDEAGSATLRVGSACVFTVICTQFPEWTIFARDQVSWSGPFVFVEELA